MRLAGILGLAAARLLKPGAIILDTNSVRHRCDAFSRSIIMILSDVSDAKGFESECTAFLNVAHSGGRLLMSDAVRDCRGQRLLSFSILRSTEENPMFYRIFALIAIMTAVFCSCPVSAEESASPGLQPTASQIVEQQAQLRADVLAKKGAFKDLAESERQALVKIQTRVLTLLDGRSEINQLGVDEKIEVFNHLQWISAAVRQAEENRQICERTRTVGSNRFQVVCMTAQESREHKERAQQSLRTSVKCQGANTIGCKDESD